MATPISSSTMLNPDKIELCISIVGGGGATRTSSGTVGASPDYVCDTPTSVLDDTFAVTANFDVAASDETSSDGDSSDGIEADLPADIESPLGVESDEEDELVRQIIGEIRKNGLQPRGINSRRVKPSESALDRMKLARQKTTGSAEANKAKGGVTTNTALGKSEKEEKEEKKEEKKEEEG